MKVLICSPGRGGHTALEFRPALRRLGAEVLHFDVALETALAGQDAMRRRLGTTLATERPDLVLHAVVGDEIPAGLLDRLRGDPAVLSVGFFSEEDWRPADAFARATRYDLALSPDLALVETLRRRGCGHVRHLPPAAGVPVVDPHTVPKRHDVALIDDPADETLRLVRAARARGIAIRVWGRGWERFADLRPIAGGLLPRGIVAETMAASRIVLAPRFGRQLLEAAAAGALPLTAGGPELSRFFAPGREVVTYGSEAELVEAIEHYLAHPTEREAIARAARARTLAEHTWEHRWRALLDDLGRHPLPGKRPLITPPATTADEPRAPRVSVVTHVYNYGEFLDELIPSVLGQSFQDFELVILDDGSTDDTEARVGRYLGDGRVRYVKQANLGHTGRLDLVLQRAVDLSRGELIAFIGGDDVLTPDRLERQVRRFDADPDLDILHTAAQHIGPDGQRLDSAFRLREPYDRWSLLRALFHTNLIAHPTVMMRRRCLDRVGPFEEATAADYRYWLKGAPHLKFRYLDEKLVAYRIHDRSSSTSPEGAKLVAEDARRIRRLTRERVTILDLYPELAHVKEPGTALAAAYTDIGNIHLTGDSPLPDLALQEYQRALEHVDPPHPVIVHNMAVALALAGEASHARRLLEPLAQAGWAPAERTRAVVAGERPGPLGLLEARAISAEIFEVAPPPGTGVWTHDGHLRDRPGEREPRRPGPAPRTASSLQIALVVHGFPPEAVSGTELYTYALAQELGRRGHAVRVLYPVYDSGRPEGAVTEGVSDGIPVARISLPAAPDPLRQLRNEPITRALRDYLRGLDMDLVHFQHLSAFSASALQVCAELSVPVVLTLHDAWLLCEQNHLIRADGRFCHDGPESTDTCAACFAARRPHLPLAAQPAELRRVLSLRRQFLRASFGFVDTLIVPTRFLARLLAAHGFDHPRVRVAPIGLMPFEPLAPEPGDGPVRFAYFGNIIPNKGLDILLRAFNGVDPRAARLHVHGRVHNQAYFEQALAGLDPDHEVTYEGPYTPADLPALLARTDVAVVPSRGENYPTIVRECLHAGVPVIASAVGGVPEIIEDGRNGLLFRVGDPEDLRRALRVFADEPGEVLAFRDRIGPVPTIAEDALQLEQTYREILDQHGRTPARPAAVRPGVREPAGDLTAPGHASGQPEAPPGEHPMVVSIIIPTFNNLELTRQCLEAIRRNTPAPACEIILVDNASTGGTRDFLRREASEGRLRAVLNDENLGFARASNQGARAARGRYLVFLNNGAVPQPGWLQALLDVIESDPSVGVVGAKLLSPDTGLVQHAGVVFGPTRTPYHIYEGWNPDHPAVNYQRDFQVVTAACCLVRREEFLAQGGFHEGYQRGFEDVDLCLSYRQAGYRIVYTPDSVLYHHHQASIRQDREHAKKARANTRLLLERWGHRIRSDALACYEQDGFQVMMNEAGHPQFCPKPGRAYTSIVIVTYNSRADLTPCLRSLYGHSGEGFELILVDNASTDGTREYLQALERKVPSARVILNEANLGFAKAINQGIRASSGAYVALLNPDTRVSPGWLGRMRAHLTEGVAAVGPLTNFANEHQAVGRYLPEWEGKPDEEIARRLWQARARQAVDAKFLTFFCTLLPRAVLERVGLLDEDFFLNQEDLEYCLRLRRAGYRLLVATDAFVYHLGGGSKMSLGPAEEMRHHYDSMRVLQRKLEALYGPGKAPSLSELLGEEVLGLACPDAGPGEHGGRPEGDRAPAGTPEPVARPIEPAGAPKPGSNNGASSEPRLEEAMASALAKGIQALQEGHYAEAEAVFLEVLNLHPTYSDLWSNLGYALTAMSRLEEAEACFLKAVSFNPDNGWAYRNLAELCYRKQAYHEALAYCGRAVRLSPDDEEALLRLARCHLLLGEAESAVRVYRALLARDPDHAGARAGLSAALAQPNPA